MRKKLTVLLTILFIGFVGLGLHDVRSNQVELQLREIKLQDTTLELNQLKLEKEKLNQEFEKATESKDINEDKVRQLEKEKLKLEEKTRELEQQLQAKAKAKERALAASRLRSSDQAVAGASTRHNVTGTKEDWLRASGIPESQWWAVDSIVSRESSWNPNAINPTSGACGLGQQLPCGKWAGAWNDPVAALKAQYGYVTARYGGYPQAVAFWNANHWY